MVQKEKCIYQAQKNERECIRQKLALGTFFDEGPALYTNYSPNNKPTLSTRLQNGTNLQICFVNDSGSDKDSDAEDSRTETSLDTPLSPMSKQSSSCSDRDGTEDDSESLDDSDFLSRQKKLQAEAKMALAMAKPMARMQVEVERQVRKKSPVEPKVKILPPSKKEIKSKTRATLVCVATDFYPDHVSIAWKINNRDETLRSKTDESAIRPDKFSNYSITSRLRVAAEEWHNTRNKFHCTVSFFNGDIYINVTATIQGIQYCGTTAEENKWSGNAAELSYILVLVKSALFALFLATFVWKLKGSSAAKFLD